MAESLRDFSVRYATALNRQDIDALAQMTHPDFVGFYPQSGERFRGFAALRAQLEKYPGGLQAGNLAQSPKVVGDEQRWMISPGYTVLPLAGPEMYTAIARSRYPDGSLWWIITIVELRDGKVIYQESYFAPDFDPPEWRREFVELVPRPEHDD